MSFLNIISGTSCAIFSFPQTGKTIVLQYLFMQNTARGEQGLVFAVFQTGVAKVALTMKNVWQVVKLRGMLWTNSEFALSNKRRKIFFLKLEKFSFKEMTKKVHYRSYLIDLLFNENESVNWPTTADKTSLKQVVKITF